MDASSSLVLVVLTLHSALTAAAAADLPAAQPRHRRLLLQQDTNLAALPLPAKVPAVPVDAHVPSHGTGSFPAASTSPQGKDGPSEAAPTTPAAYLSRSMRWLYMVVLPAVALLLLAGLACWLLCRKSAVATIGPWKTGLSGQLQKAFVTGVPKLQRSELERACEDFSNIVASYPHYTVYKGTLSTGVEIAVVSTMITSSKEWSEHSESCFRRKIDTLSRINHKNFVNLLGFCEEEEPFTRMLVLEYAPNGTLYESLHAEDFEHIAWRGRMRIIMGLAYCIQHMHELNPPVVHPDLQSSSILLSEDGAAKIVDMSVWHEVISEGKTMTNGELDHHQEQVSAGLAGNIHSFGVLLLEIISGKLPFPYPGHERSLVSSGLTFFKRQKVFAVRTAARNLYSSTDPELGQAQARREANATMHTARFLSLSHEQRKISQAVAPCCAITRRACSLYLETSQPDARSPAAAHDKKPGAACRERCRFPSLAWGKASRETNHEHEQQPQPSSRSHARPTACSSLPPSLLPSISSPLKHSVPEI